MATEVQLLKRLEKSGRKAAYDSVLIDEYSALDTIEIEPQPEVSGYYIAYHAVCRQDSSTTKKRVVLFIFY